MPLFCWCERSHRHLPPPPRSGLLTADGRSLPGFRHGISPYHVMPLLSPEENVLSAPCIIYALIADIVEKLRRSIIRPERSEKQEVRIEDLHA